MTEGLTDRPAPLARFNKTVDRFVKRNGICATHKRSLLASGLRPFGVRVTPREGRCHGVTEGVDRQTGAPLFSPPFPERGVYKLGRFATCFWFGDYVLKIS